MDNEVTDGTEGRELIVSKFVRLTFYEVAPPAGYQGG